MELFQQYIQEASSDELNAIINQCQAALARRQQTIGMIERDTWLKEYQKWFDEYPLNGKLPIKRVVYGGTFSYEVESDKLYDLYINKGYIEIQIANTDASECRVCITLDGTHQGCERDGCHDFDGLINIPEFIPYLVSFWANVHEKMENVQKALRTTRLK